MCDFQQVKVSITCNAYNHGKYIRDALEGFVNQVTDFDYEVLCDTMCLAKCDYLVFSHSNVTTAAMLINGDQYKGTYMCRDR